MGPWLFDARGQLSKDGMSKQLSFEDAIKLFKGWGFQVEPGPHPNEVTLILEEDGHRTYAVHPAKMLPEIAKTALYIRWRNGSVMRRQDQRAGLTCD
jgi:hypothetical protein